MRKWIKRGVIAAVLLTGAGVVVGINTDLRSYARTSSRAISTAFKDTVPIEFELRRARDLLEDLVPEMHANLRIVAAEEVEVASLEKELDREAVALTRQRERVRKLRDALQTEQTTYSFGVREYRRAEVVEELSRGFEGLKTAEMLLDGKKGLLRNRRRSLDAALKKLEKTRLSRIELASQIEALEGQFRLVQAQSGGTQFSLDETKLAQTQRLIDALKKRLSVAQRVLARESRFVETIPLDPVSENRVRERVDAYFRVEEEGETTGNATSPGVSF